MRRRWTTGRGVRGARIAILGGATLLATSCSAPRSTPGDAPQTPPAAVRDAPPTSGLERIALATPGKLYMRPGRPIGAYDSFKLKDVTVTFRHGRYNRDDEERIRDHVRSSLLADMRATRLPIVEQADGCTLLVEVGILDIDLTDAIDATGSGTHFVTSWGRATIVQRLFDGATGAPLMEFSDRRPIPGGRTTTLTDGRDWQQIKKTLDRLMRESQAAFLAGLPVVDTPPSKPGCHGGIDALRRRSG